MDIARNGTANEFMRLYGTAKKREQLSTLHERQKTAHPEDSEQITESLEFLIRERESVNINRFWQRRDPCGRESYKNEDSMSRPRQPVLGCLGTILVVTASY